MSSHERALRKVVSSALQHLRASALCESASQPGSAAAVVEPVVAAVEQREDIIVASYLAAVHLCTVDAAERARYESEAGVINWDECEKIGVGIADKIASKTKSSRDGNTAERLAAAATAAFFFLVRSREKKGEAQGEMFQLDRLESGACVLKCMAEGRGSGKGRRSQAQGG